jgi:UDP-N-acetylglucosamine:LPS N-acetylglucosamine transferase
MSKPAVIMVTSNGVGAGHLIRASAIARKLHSSARPIILSMAYSVVEVATALGIEAEFIPGKDKRLMAMRKWDNYLRDRILALIDESGAKVVTFDGVVPYPGFLAAKSKRPEIVFLWIRRGMWQASPRGLALALQSRLVDQILEPGDFARDYDNGPTKNRKDATLFEPVSLYESSRSMRKQDAKNFLGLSGDKSSVLVQIGVGASDLNERVSAILRGLSGWENIEIVMAKEPKDELGNSLIPDGIPVKVIKHFPLADVIHAFDAIVCAAGYNSVHEVIPAGIPTLLIANNRGTDNQFARAKWCRDQGLTLYADSDSLIEVQSQAELLKDSAVRNKLINRCASIKSPGGASEIAQVILKSVNSSTLPTFGEKIKRRGFLAQNFLSRGLLHLLRRAANTVLYWASLLYRSIFPHKDIALSELQVIISQSLDLKFCDSLIRSNKRFEHILNGSSERYLATRRAIAIKAYRVKEDLILSS